MATIEQFFLERYEHLEYVEEQERRRAESEKERG